jgi:hypothetical protein
MKHIIVPFLSSDLPTIHPETNDGWLALPKHFVDVINWEDYPYKPEVCFSIAYSEKGIFLRFEVIEEAIRGLVMQDNGNVYTDSCVEMFIDPSGDGTYYNFEFNCIGTLLLGFGSSRNNREKASQKIMDQVIRFSSLKKKSIEQGKGTFSWSLNVFVPFSAFFNHHIASLARKKIRANFLKCGDAMPMPHFVTWNPIDTPKPDYHRPEFFGEMVFE